MCKKITYTSNSIDCLETISIYISKDSIRKADEFIDKILNKIEILEDFPNLGEKIENNCRKLVINKNYKVIYEIKEKDIIILHILNVKKF